MPDGWTHILCGDDIIKSLENSEFRDMIIGNIEIFHLGNQGPDPFFYYRFYPTKSHKRVTGLGGLLHHEKTGEFFIEGIKMIKRQEKGPKFELLFAYIAGFMCHFAMDYHTHPYIFYFGGIHDKENKETKKYGSFHKKLEIIIDTILLEEKRGLKTYREKLYKQIDIGKDLPEIILEFYEGIFNDLFSKNVSKVDINNSYRDMKRYLNLLRDPLGFKRVLLTLPELLGANESKIKNAIYPRSIKRDIDYLNRKHAEWNHPCCKEEFTEKSFDDLYNEAVIAGRKFIINTIDFIDGRISLEEVNKLFLNISYDTGKPIDTEHKLKYYRCIFD